MATRPTLHNQNTENQKNAITYERVAIMMCCKSNWTIFLFLLFYYNFLIILIVRVGMLNSVNFTSI